MKQNRRIIAMLFLLIFSVTVLSIAERKYHGLEREQCFAHLQEYTEQIGNEIRTNYKNNEAYLQEVAEMCAEMDLKDDRMLGKVLELLHGSGMIDEAQLLFPGDQLMTEDGTKQDMSDQISFQEEAAKGSCLSHRMYDPLQPERMILRLQVPIIQEGETAALLWGIIDLRDFSNMFTVQGYGEKMQLYVLEGTTGNYLLDTWHEELSDLNSLGTRKTMQGYRQEQMVEDMEKGRTGVYIYLSQTAGEYFYSYYCPVGVADWSVMITVPESVVFSHAEETHKSQMRIMIAMFAAFVVYGIWMLRDAKKEKSANEKRLRRVQYLLDVEKQLFSAFLHPSHFVDGIKVIADYAEAEKAFFWTSEKYQVNGCRLWTSDNDERIKNFDPDEHFSGILSLVREKGSLLIYDTEEALRMYPTEAERMKKNGIYNMMLLLVKKLNGEEVGVWGVYNMRYHWENTELLDQVSLTFSMTLDHHENYVNLINMSRMDSLTGLWNRNRYHTALEQIKKETYCSMACVYLDVNGLHEINNRLGHEAGDQMLKTVSDILKECFPRDEKYRIGGDEFVVLCQNREEEEIRGMIQVVRQKARDKGYEVAIGMGWGKQSRSITEIVNEAETVMREDKEQYYRENGGERQRRMLDQEHEWIISQKRDMDSFLRVLAPQFKGVYFVDLKEDSTRYIFIPDYFEKMLRRSEGKFSKALMLYAREVAREEYVPLFDKVCDFIFLENLLSSRQHLEFTYWKKDGVRMKLQILNYYRGAEENRETLWIFKELDEA